MIRLYGMTKDCEACDEARQALDRQGYKYEFVDVTKDRWGATLFRSYKTIPLIEIDGEIRTDWYNIGYFGFVPNGKNVKIPTRSTKMSAGYDFYMPENLEILPMNYKLIDTKVSVKMPNNYCMMLLPRSSNLIKRGLAMPGGTGLIDADYTGNVNVYLQNITTRTIKLSKGDRIAQGVFVEYGKIPTDRATGQRTGGFGSTGL